jgi:hypothetical protein
MTGGASSIGFAPAIRRSSLRSSTSAPSRGLDSTATGIRYGLVKAARVDIHSDEESVMFKFDAIRLTTIAALGALSIL